MSHVGIVSDWLSSDEEAAGDLAAYIYESGAAMDLGFEMRDGEAREFLLSMSQSDEGQHLASAFAASEAGLDAARYFAGHIAPDLIQAIEAMDLQLVELHGARDAVGLLLVVATALVHRFACFPPTDPSSSGRPGASCSPIASALAVSC